VKGIRFAIVCDLMHPIERKLRVEICPYLVTAKRLSRWRPYRVYLGYSYLGEVFVLLAGFGFANPVTSFLSGGQGNSQSGEKVVTVAQFLAGSWVGWTALILLLIWGVVKFYIRREDLEKRCSLLKSCQQQCAQLEYQLRKALPVSDPMEELTKIQTKIGDLVDVNIAERSWCHSGPEPGIDTLVDKYCSELVSSFSGYWIPAPNLDRI